MKSPMARYQDALASRLLLPDSEQHEAVALLESCFQQLITKSQSNAAGSAKGSWSSLKASILGAFPFLQSGHQEASSPQQSGCYIWGGVGRGKTLLMDYFHESLPAHVRSKRTHFHRFMREIHEQMHDLSGTANPLEAIGARYAKNYDVLCLDEFVVIDITDAMLLAGLVGAFFSHGLMLITTSNAVPSALYKDGLQRQRFLPAIAQLEYHLTVHHLDAGVDYRLRHLHQHPTYILVQDANEGVLQMGDVFKENAARHIAQPGKIDINGRVIQHLGCHNNIVWFSFEAICGQMRSVSDYIELAKEFHVVMVSSVPQLGTDREDQTRRFIHLVDELYDCRVKLILAAEVPLDQLYNGRKVAFEFERTRSRLIEMQSDDYLSAKISNNLKM